MEVHPYNKRKHARLNTYTQNRKNMPIYEYKCDYCQNQFEAIRKMAEADEPISCPNCHQQVTKRMVTAAMAFSDGHAVSGSAQFCVGCSSGNCGSCGH